MACYRNFILVLDMKNFKEIATIIVPYVVTCAVMYLIGSFINASWSPQDWTWMSRFVSAVWGLVFGFMLMLRLNRGEV